MSKLSVDLSDVFSLLNEQKVAFFLRGKFTERYTNVIVDLSENVAGQIEEGFFSRKMSFMLVESFQNILKHGQTEDKLGVHLADHGIFSFKASVKGSFINSINFIQSSDATGLKMSIDYINGLDKASLKSYYMDSLKNNQMSSKGGAGLGFIEIARKSGSKILYRIDENQEGPILFHQQISLRSDNIAESESDEIEHTDRIYQFMCSHGLTMLFKGDFSPKIMLPLMELAEQAVKEENEESQQSMRSAHVVVEMIQNIQRHGFQLQESSGQGYFALGKNKDSVVLITANLVAESETADLRNRIDEINSLDDAGRKDLLRNTLKSSLAQENTLGRGLGLTEIAGSTSSPLKYSFQQASHQLNWFTLQVEI